MFKPKIKVISHELQRKNLNCDLQKKEDIHIRRNWEMCWTKNKIKKRHKIKKDHTKEKIRSGKKEKIKALERRSFHKILFLQKPR